MAKKKKQVDTVKQGAIDDVTDGIKSLLEELYEMGFDDGYNQAELDAEKGK